MYFCYLDESGTATDEATKTFVLVGVAIPSSQWKRLDSRISECKRTFGLEDAEIHTGWMLRRFHEQDRIPGFAELDRTQRRTEVDKVRRAKLLHTAAINPKKLKDLQKAYKKTNAYIHLSLGQRRAAVSEVAKIFAHCTDARLFGYAVDKTFAAKFPKLPPIFELAFERVVNRFQAFLQHRALWAQGNPNTGHLQDQDLFGVLIQDNNETVASKLTQLMRKFHKLGTKLRAIDRIVETPLFVDSELTCMVQVADICAYAVRRFVDNGEQDLFNILLPRVDRAGSAMVGLRHFADRTCSCRICGDFRMGRLSPLPPAI